MIKKHLYVLKSPQYVIGLFLLVLVIVARNIGMDLATLFNDSLIKFSMNGIFVLSLLPMLNSGMGMNFGMPVGVVAGLIGLCIAVNYNIVGVSGIIVSMVLGCLVAVFFGIVYGRILLGVSGREEIAGTFIGYSFIPIMNFFWTLAPFSNRQMLYPIGGSGLRPRIGLNAYFGKVIDNSLYLSIGDIGLPMGMLLVYVLIGGFLIFFYRTSIGKAMLAVGENPNFAKASGMDCDRLKKISVCFSLALGAIGICVYAQSFGFIELYDAPMTIAFPAVSALLIGGATANKGTVLQGIVGTYLFQSIYLLSVPIANELLLPEVSEIMRTIIANGIILYALLMSHQRRNLYGASL